MTTLTLQTVIENYVSPIAGNSWWNRERYIAYKSTLDNKRSHLYSQLRPGQNFTKRIIDQQYNQSLKEYATNHQIVEDLFPLIDMSFLTEPTGSFPRWAIYDANNVEPFRIRYSTTIEFRHVGDWITWHEFNPKGVEISASASTFVQPTQYGDLFCKFRSPSYGDGLYITLNNYVLCEVLKLCLAPEMRSNTSGIVYMVPTGTELYGQLSNQKLVSTSRQFTLQFAATFDHFVPESVNKTIDDFGLLFDELLFIAEVPNWQASEITIIPASDPLLVGRRGKEYRLLDAFDVTDAEEHIRQKFSR